MSALAKSINAKSGRIRCAQEHTEVRIRVFSLVIPVTDPWRVRCAPAVAIPRPGHGATLGVTRSQRALLAETGAAIAHPVVRNIVHGMTDAPTAAVIMVAAPHSISKAATVAVPTIQIKIASGTRTANHVSVPEVAMHWTREVAMAHAQKTPMLRADGTMVNVLARVSGHVACTTPTIARDITARMTQAVNATSTTIAAFAERQLHIVIRLQVNTSAANIPNAQKTRNIRANGISFSSIADVLITAAITISTVAMGNAQKTGLLIAFGAN